MDRVLCIILAGGRGSRFGSPLKFLSSICGKPLLERLVESMEIVCRHILIALSKRTLNASYICRSSIVDCIETSGEGFVEDLSLLLDIFPKPLLTIAADIYIPHRNILTDFLKNAVESEEDITTLTMIDKSGYEEPIGIALFKKARGSWRNVRYPQGSMVDVDGVDDLESARRLCQSYYK